MTRIRRWGSIAWFSALVVGTAACGGGSYAPESASADYYGGAVAAGGEMAPAESGAAYPPEPGAAYEDEAEYSVDTDDYGGDEGAADEPYRLEVNRAAGAASASPMAAPSPQLAQATPGAGGGQDPGAPAAAPDQATAQSADQEATDATAASGGPLLIYSATLNLSVYEVEESQRAIVAIAQELGGFVQKQSDTELIVRIPARRFRDALGRVEEVGDVLHRNVEALDVSEEFRDVTIRIRNAEAMRDRLEALLTQARTVEDALRVERELERITEVIERMKGRLRFIADRIAFSTVTVQFAARPREHLDQPGMFRLPFPWLDQLGLRNLLNLR